MCNFASAFRKTKFLSQISSDIEMKKNSPISRYLVILHALNKRGFFAAPLSTVFSVRPIPFWVRR
jgi:hypothetical protein